METNVNQVEEIPCSEPMTPQMHLKINLNLKEREQSLSPPPRHPDKEVKKRSAEKRVARRRIHKLRSYEHLVRDLPLSRRDKRFARYQTRGDSGRSEAKVPGSAGHENEGFAYLFFVEGFKNMVNGDEELMLRTILELLSEQVVSVGRQDPLFLCENASSQRVTVQHAGLHSALLALNEVLDPAVLDISRLGMVEIGQCLTVVIFFHDHLTALNRSVWQSSYAQFLRDAWMGFGCVGAMVIMSSMRQ